MALLTLDRVTMHYGGPVLLDGVSLEVHPGARIGIVGANGAGKSTLLHLLAGRLEPASGSVTRARTARVALQEQEPRGARPGIPVREEMRGVFGDVTALGERLTALAERIAAAEDPEEREALLAAYARLEREHEHGGGHEVDRRIETVLSHLGVPASSMDRPFDSFSGGERSVLGLARVLLSEPDVLLLDEPSNHLDMEGVEWFIELLADHPGAVVMVSHNRHLLDAAVDVIWEVGHGRVTAWTGSYGDYVRQKEQARALQERQFEVQQRLIRRIEFQARRLKDMANAYDDPGQARRARSMLKRLERIEKVDAPDAGPKRFKARITGDGAAGRIALAVTDYDLARGERVLFEGASVEIEQGERVALTGPNGSGKTSLLRAVLDGGSWENPTLRLGKSVRVGEYRQFHDDFDPTLPIQEWLWRETKLDDKDTAAVLHRFLFTRDDLGRTIGTLSGGEKSRLQLARLVTMKINFLVLDEPTNHLDIPACEQLEEMLEEFDGTLLVVSHDRYFLDRLVTRVVEVVDRGLVSHPMGFTEWWRMKRDAGRRRKRALAEHGPLGASGTASGPRSAAPTREQQRALKRDRERLERLEREVGRAETRRAETLAALEAAASEAYDRSRLARLEADHAEAQARLAALYAEWEALAATLEDA
jgi:ATP-binding cassette, subfamily F, member 3